MQLCLPRIQQGYYYLGYVNVNAVENISPELLNIYSGYVFLHQLALNNAKLLKRLNLFTNQLETCVPYSGQFLLMAQRSQKFSHSKWGQK